MNELESIIQQMVSAGESEENIRIVIENYQSTEVSGNQEAVAGETAGVTAISGFTRELKIGRWSFRISKVNNS
jgi:hypothetical protein